MTLHRRPAIAAIAFLFCAAASTAQTVTEFPIPRAGAFPHDPAFTEDGIVWYTDQSNSYIGRLDPATGSFVDYATPTRRSGPHGITVAPDGYVWYTAQDSGRLGRVDPATGQITEYVLPANANRPHTPLAHQGAIWFTAQSNSTYGRFDPGTGMTQVFNVPSGSRPYGICAGPDGVLWIALFGTNALARVDPATGTNQLFRLPSSSARPRRLVVSQDNFVFYTDYPRGYLGRLDPTNGQVTEWLSPTGTGSRPYGIAIGSDGRVWFNASGSNRMIPFDPRSLQMQQTVVIPTSGNTVRHMVCDFDRGRLWLALSGTQRIGLIQLDVPVTYFGAACAGSAGTPTFEVSGIPRIGETLTFTVGNTAAAAGALSFGGSNLLWNGLGLPYELSLFGAAGCFVNSSWDVTLSAGPGSLPVTVPVVPALNGAVVYAQWALLGDPSGLSVVTTRSVKLILIGA